MHASYVELIARVVLTYLERALNVLLTKFLKNPILNPVHRASTQSDLLEILLCV